MEIFLHLGCDNTPDLIPHWQLYDIVPQCQTTGPWLQYDETGMDGSRNRKSLIASLTVVAHPRGTDVPSVTVHPQQFEH